LEKAMTTLLRGAPSVPSAPDPPNRPDPNVLSYFWMRKVLGILGIALPFAFIIGEGFFLRGGVQVRGSLSAYYHTSMHDLFVGGLCVTGFLLVTYMAGRWRSPAFWLSLVAGLAVFGVALFPTSRPLLPAGLPLAAVQQQFGEHAVAIVHFSCAAVFILSLACIAFLFAKESTGVSRTFQSVCGSVIIGAVALAAAGMLGWWSGFWQLTPLYLGEVISVWAFGASWLLKANGG
jgi:hypothetical protein